MSKLIDITLNGFVITIPQYYLENDRFRIEKFLEAVKSPKFNRPQDLDGCSDSCHWTVFCREFLSRVKTPKNGNDNTHTVLSAFVRCIKDYAPFHNLKTEYNESRQPLEVCKVYQNLDNLHRNEPLNDRYNWEDELVDSVDLFVAEYPIQGVDFIKEILS